MSFWIDMFITADSSEKQFSARKLSTQTNVQGNFWVVHMETCKNEAVELSQKLEAMTLKKVERKA